MSWRVNGSSWTMAWRRHEISKKSECSTINTKNPSLSSASWTCLMSSRLCKMCCWCALSFAACSGRSMRKRCRTRLSKKLSGTSSTTSRNRAIESSNYSRISRTITKVHLTLPSYSFASITTTISRSWPRSCSRERIKQNSTENTQAKPICDHEPYETTDITVIHTTAL